jgi:hypothetical protein
MLGDSLEREIDGAFSPGLQGDEQPPTSIGILATPEANAIRNSA